jgi:hypothetical protein
MVAAWIFAVQRWTEKRSRAGWFFAGLLLATYTALAPVFVVLLAAFGVYNDPELKAASVTAVDRWLLIPALVAIPLLALGHGKARWLAIASCLMADVVAGFFILGASYYA